MQSIRKPSLVDQVYTQLRQAIITLEFPLGSKLNVSELQEQTGVSCTPIREAINRLQQEGLVVYENNVGARIISLEEHDITEIQQLAMALHTTAIRLAVASSDLNEVCSALQTQLRNLKNAGTVREEVMAISEFIGTYYHHCGNKRLDSSMLSIQGQQHLLRYIYVSRQEQRYNELDTFEGMIVSTMNKDADAVCSTLQAYTDAMTDVLKEWVQNR